MTSSRSSESLESMNQADSIDIPPRTVAMLKSLQESLEGTICWSEVTRRLYATDASVYRELPLAVTIPRNDSDIVKIVQFADKLDVGLIPRTAGTSLAGQVVGNGIVIDMSHHFQDILEIDSDNAWVWVQPGIVRDDLNRVLAPRGVFFAPETSTSNRAMIGGMIGNNSCGSNSIRYGSTREHLLEVRAVLSDGTQAWFGPMDEPSLQKVIDQPLPVADRHGQIYQQLNWLLSNQQNQNSIRDGYPSATIPRRNTGYALDMLLHQRPFSSSDDKHNLCSLIAGSEGTLAIVTAAKLKLTKLPPMNKLLVCIHCQSIDESLRANLIALKYSPSASELIDRFILDATLRNTMYAPYRTFVQGTPEALLVVELTNDSPADLKQVATSFIQELLSAALGYAYPVLQGEEMSKVWSLRKAGLGLLSNVPGDPKPVAVVEDTAVDVHLLPEYIREFGEILSHHGLESVHYAHAGSGELHLRPILNLKTENGQRLFRLVAQEIAQLVRRYRGSLSGEHGDGRLRAEFIPIVIGENNYQLCKEVKRIWDPRNRLNPGKIVDAQPMDASLRFSVGQSTPEIETMFDFTETQGFVRATEQCSGSGDCRKTALSGGTMCPSYMVTRDEKDTTRARANILREMLTKSERKLPLASEEIKDVMDLCLSCKGCKSECPSNVDVGKLKAEWQHHYYKQKGTPIRARLIGEFASAMSIASRFPALSNLLLQNRITSRVIKSMAGFAAERTLPTLSKTSFSVWFKSYKATGHGQSGAVCLFVDEFTEYNDAEIGISAVKLLDRLGFKVRIITNHQSGRTYLSKGLLPKAKELAEKNVALYTDALSPHETLIGIEPSAILTFRDEYTTLTRGSSQRNAVELSKRTFLIDEFLANEIDKNKIDSSLFTDSSLLVKLHGHCHQKALSTMTATRRILSLPINYKVHLIPSGCCGMAGSFGFEREHYELSMKIGELILFPTIRQQPEEVAIAATGTSCRHQIRDGTGRVALHPVQILCDALV